MTESALPADHQTTSEVRDGMRVDWDVPIPMDDGPRAAGRRVPARRRWGATRSCCPTAPTPRGWRSRRAIPAPGTGWRRNTPTLDRGGIHQQVPELGGLRPREVGSRRLCVPAGGRPGMRPLARLHRPLLAAGDPGPLRLHRVGRGPALERRQDRALGGVVLRHEPMDRGLPPAAAPRGDDPLGGRRRVVPRLHPPRRHGLDVLGQLVRHAGQDGCSTASAPAAR